MSLATETVDKSFLEKNYGEILRQGTLNPEEIRHFEARGEFPAAVVVQSTSGSTGEPFRIPRDLADMGDFMERLGAYFLRKFQRAPGRLAMIGGISHTEGAAKMPMPGGEARIFAPGETSGLRAFNPEVLFSYPSVMRDLLYELGPEALGRLPDLKAVKLGGEPVFAEDLRRIRRAFPDVLLIEQLGSTEMPALAFKEHLPVDEGQSRYDMQTRRFSFAFREDSDRWDWQPLLVRDNFPGLLFPIPGFYDTGDEVQVQDNRILKVRRRNHPGNPFIEELENFLNLGCVNVQLRLEAGVLAYYGPLALPEVVLLQGREFRTTRTVIERIKPSNKMPLVI